MLYSLWRCFLYRKESESPIVSVHSKLTDLFPFLSLFVYSSYAQCVQPDSDVNEYNSLRIPLKSSVSSSQAFWMRQVVIFLLCLMKTVSLHSNNISVILSSHLICIDLPLSESSERTCFYTFLDYLGRIFVSLPARSILMTSIMVK